jgi:two-component system chemotaxis sensor kinase CheA
MSFGADEEILQDFLVEAGEILEQLSEQLVELESRPDDADLLNAIFRGFHTVKGGAGFLQLNELVECCHIAENVFDILRKGERRVDSELMDVVLEALDAVNGMFSEVRERSPVTAATPELLAALARLAEPQSADEVAAAPVAPEVEAPVVAADSGDITDNEFEQLLDSLNAVKAQAEAPAVVPAPASEVPATDEITDAEFESLLDQLHGKGKFAVDAVAPAPAAPAEPPAAKEAGDSADITDEEFEALLDQLHGKGNFAVEALESAIASVPAPAAPTAAAAGSDLISDHEFEALLDELHGKGKFSEVGTATTASSSNASVAVSTAKVDAPKPVAKAPEPKAQAPAPVAAAPAARAPAAPPAEKPASEAETTVRVDTARLDEIMNMVGELVLVRNRLVRLGANSADEAMSKAVSNLDVVTADLQTAVMKTRMQPIKKVFGRFPRLVRDLARQLKKEINLELVGEDTDLDKNLVEALADPLVHLVRNAVDHGIESPQEREASGKARGGKVILAAEQEGDHILLSISDDGKGMDPNVLRAIAVKRGVMDKDAADRLSDTECYNLIFAPGFSTKTEISDVLGQGPGIEDRHQGAADPGDHADPDGHARQPGVRLPAGERQRDFPPRPVAHQRGGRPGSGDRAGQGTAVVLPQALAGQLRRS